MKKQKTVYQYLLTIPGFGEYRAKQILASLGIAISTKMRISNLAQSEIKQKNKLNLGFGAVNRKPTTTPAFKETLLLQALASLRKSSTWTKYNSKPCVFETEKVLLKNKQDNIKGYISNLSYRGGRIKLGYPVNGGRTRSNGQTAKKALKNNIQVVVKRNSKKNI